VCLAFQVTYYTFIDICPSAHCVKSNKQHSGNSARPAQKQNPAEATLRIGATMAVPAVLRSLGADPATILAEVGLDPKLFDNPDNLISYAARARLIKHCVARTGCQHFGLLVGQNAGLQSLGLVGLLVKYSPDVGAALRSLVRYLHLHIRGASTTLTLEAETVMLSYEIHVPLAEATDQIGDGAVALMFNVMRTLCGPEWGPSEVRFAHDKPDDVTPFRRYFRAPLRFDAEENALVFSADWFGHALPGSDPLLRRLLQKQVDALEVQNGRDFPEQVRNVLRSSIVTGHARADQVAAIFSMHARTLNRHLNAFGISFRELADESRFEIARQMLETSAMEVAQIAAMLDYADASAFTRAFRRWSGTTPARWRATHRSP
jgi:AraC-like DNA-binding protein